MAITAIDLLEWVAGHEPDELVWIDDGGLALRSDSGSYLEIGGEPPDKDDFEERGAE